MRTEQIQLSHLPVGSHAVIAKICDQSSDGDRLMDLGFTPGQKISVLFKSPAKNPIAYEIMGAVLALRHEDAEKIIVFPISD